MFVEVRVAEAASEVSALKKSLEWGLRTRFLSVFTDASIAGSSGEPLDVRFSVVARTESQEEQLWKTYGARYIVETLVPALLGPSDSPRMAVLSGSGGGMEALPKSDRALGIKFILGLGNMSVDGDDDQLVEAARMLVGENWVIVRPEVNLGNIPDSVVKLLDSWSDRRS